VPRNSAAAVPTIFSGAGWPFSVFGEDEERFTRERLIALGRQHRANDLIPRPVLVELPRQPFDVHVVRLNPGRCFPGRA